MARRATWPGSATVKADRVVGSHRYMALVKMPDPAMAEVTAKMPKARMERMKHSQWVERKRMMDVKEEHQLDGLQQVSFVETRTSPPPPPQEERFDFADVLACVGAQSRCLAEMAWHTWVLKLCLGQELRRHHSGLCAMARGLGSGAAELPSRIISYSLVPASHPSASTRHQRSITDWPSQLPATFDDLRLYLAKLIQSTAARRDAEPPKPPECRDRPRRKPRRSVCHGAHASSRTVGSLAFRVPFEPSYEEEEDDEFEASKPKLRPFVLPRQMQHFRCSSIGRPGRGAQNFPPRCSDIASTTSRRSAAGPCQTPTNDPGPQQPNSLYQSTLCATKGRRTARGVRKLKEEHQLDGLHFAASQFRCKLEHLLLLLLHLLSRKRVRFLLHQSICHGFEPLSVAEQA